MFGKAPLTSREAMMRSTGSMSAMVSWRKIASCEDLPWMAPQRLAGIWGSRWGRMRRGRTVQTILTSVMHRLWGASCPGWPSPPFCRGGGQRLPSLVVAGFAP